MTLPKYQNTETYWGQVSIYPLESLSSSTPKFPTQKTLPKSTKTFSYNQKPTLQLITSGKLWDKLSISFAHLIQTSGQETKFALSTNPQP